MVFLNLLSLGFEPFGSRFFLGGYFKLFVFGSIFRRGEGAKG